MIEFCLEAGRAIFQSFPARQGLTHAHWMSDQVVGSGEISGRRFEHPVDQLAAQNRQPFRRHVVRGRVFE